MIRSDGAEGIYDFRRGSLSCSDLISSWGFCSSFSASFSSFDSVWSLSWVWSLSGAGVSVSVSAAVVTVEAREEVGAVEEGRCCALRLLREEVSGFGVGATVRGVELRREVEPGLVILLMEGRCEEEVEEVCCWVCWVDACCARAASSSSR